MGQAKLRSEEPGAVATAVFSAGRGVGIGLAADAAGAVLPAAAPVGLAVTAGSDPWIGLGWIGGVVLSLGAAGAVAVTSPDDAIGGTFLMSGPGARVSLIGGPVSPRGGVAAA